MREQAAKVIASAAASAGLSEDRVIDLVKKDNLTIERPRIELQFLPEKLERTGRKLAVWRTKTEQIRKSELYEAKLEVAANVLAEDEEWLSAFCYAFIAALPRGFNDHRGNWVKVTAEKATFGRPPDRRVGDSVIEVFKKVNELLLISFVWRITAEEADALIRTWEIKFEYRGESNVQEKIGNTGSER